MTKSTFNLLLNFWSVIFDLWLSTKGFFFIDNSLNYSVFIRSGTGNGSNNEYTFQQHQEPQNYEKWTRDISFVLEKATFWRPIEVTAVSPPFFKAKKDNSEDWIEKIFDQDKKIKEFQDNRCKEVAKIGKMCIDTIPKKFLSLKASREWSSKKQWIHLKTQYKLLNYTFKLNTPGKLHDHWNGNWKNIQEFMSKIRHLKSEIEDGKSPWMKPSRFKFWIFSTPLLRISLVFSSTKSEKRKNFSHLWSCRISRECRIWTEKSR